MTTIESFFRTAARLAPRLCWKHGGREYTWTEAAQRVRRAARAYVALGVKPGDKVNIIGPNVPEWLQADLGALAAGAVPAPIYPTLTPEQAQYIAKHSEAPVAIAGDASLREKLASDQRVFLMTEWDAFLALGDSIPDSAVDERLAQIKDHSLATLIYTSGTTGPPKAAMLSHKNLWFAAETGRRIAQVSENDVFVCYLPLSHIAEQMISIHGPCMTGATGWFCDDLPKLPDVLRAARPTVFVGVPRVWEKLQARIEEGIAAAPAPRRAIVGWARRNPGFLSSLVLRKLREKLGLDRTRFCITAAAKMNVATLRFFESIGLVIYDLWGMTESTAMGTTNLPGANKWGTVGKPEQGVEIRLAPDGEIVTRGPHVFLGYYKDEGATRDAIDGEGFLHTGDVGELDPDGYLRITDRKKDLLITSGGKNVSPQNIEVQLGRIPGVAHAVVVGDARKHLAALIVPEKVERAADPAFVAGIGRAIEDVNSHLAHYETIKKFKVLPVSFGVDTGELTPTLKLKRKVVAQRFAREIEELFS